MKWLWLDRLYTNRDEPSNVVSVDVKGQSSEFVVYRCRNLRWKITVANSWTSAIVLHCSETSMSPILIPPLLSTSLVLAILNTIQVIRRDRLSIWPLDIDELHRLASHAYWVCFDWAPVNTLVFETSHSGCCRYPAIADYSVVKSCSPTHRHATMIGGRCENQITDGSL